MSSDVIFFCHVFFPRSHHQSSRRPNFKELNNDMLRYQRWLLNNTKAFYTPVIAEDLRLGTQYLLQVCVYLFSYNFAAL